MRRLLAVAATITAVTVPSVPRSLASGSTPQTRESQTVRSSSAERDAVAITVYNQNFGLVREARTLHLTGGRVDVEYADVASGIRPETVHIRPLSDGALAVLHPLGRRAGAAAITSYLL